MFDLSHLSRSGNDAAPGRDGGGADDGGPESSTMMTTLLQDILGLEEEHVAGLAYGGMQPHSRSVMRRRVGQGEGRERRKGEG